MRIRNVLSQGYYFKEDVDFLNDIKDTLKNVKYEKDYGFYVPQRIQKLIGKLDIE